MKKIAVAKEKKRKAYLKEYMATRRKNNEFRNKQNRALQAKRSENIEKTRESQRRAFNRRKESNSDHIRELNRQAFAKSKKTNPQHAREVNRNAQNRKGSSRAALRKYQLNLEIAKKSNFSKLAQNEALRALVTKILF